MKAAWLSASLLVTACADQPMIAAHIVSRVTPNYAPHRDDAIAIVLPNIASAEDRALTALLASELPRDGFRLVDKPQSSRWILQASYVVAAAPTSSAVADANPRPASADNVDIRLSLYSVTEFINGEHVAVWTSTAYGEAQFYRQHPRALMRLLLQKFGGDVDGRLQTVDLERAASEPP